MLAWALLALLAADPAPAEPSAEFPYQATVRVDRARVRSGPGREHFITQELSRGAEVEVHRVDPGGWLAIRPPAGSMSWVSAESCSEVVDGVATVETRGLASLVGSQFNDQRGSFQVVLDEGEALEVIDEVMFEDDQGARRWLMIAPPAGEFRWIAAADVRRPGDPEPQESEAKAAEPTDAIDDAPIDAAPAAYQDAEDEPAPQLAPPVQRQWTSAKRPLAPSSSTSVEPDRAQTIADELDVLEMELSAMLTDSPDAWHVEPLRQRVDNLLLLPHTSADSQRALTLARRMDRFSDLARRAQTAPPMRAARAPRVDAPVAPVAAPALAGAHGFSSAPFLAQAMVAPAPMTATRPLLGNVPPPWIAPPPPAWSLVGAPTPFWQPPAPGFDASGVLRPVILPGQSAPAYAIVDAQGRAVSYVATVPGVDLSPYVGHAVGVNGPRGFDLERRAPLVRAQHVTVLDGTMLR